jgi:Ca2+-transporting ATPase
MAFTTLMLFQLFNLFNADPNATVHFTACSPTPGCGVNSSYGAAADAVVYSPFLQRAFSTAALTAIRLDPLRAGGE